LSCETLEVRAHFERGSSLKIKLTQFSICSGYRGIESITWMVPSILAHPASLLRLQVVLPLLGKAFFECRFNQYLGHISFALYLVHGPIIWTLGDRLYVATGWYREAHEIYTPHWINRFPLSKAGPLGLELSFLAPHIILLPFSFWIAEIVTKLVDEPTVQFGQWVYAKMLPPVELQTKQ
jgi:peptidoglycan/LPS O-acetylase OafA/YrhL